MKNTRSILKVLTLLNAVLLLGGYVWYRSSHAQAAPAPVSDVPAPASSVTASTVTDHERGEFMRSSKSGGIFDATEPMPDDVKRSEFIISSKSGAVFTGREAQAPVASVKKDDVDERDRFIISNMGEIYVGSDAITGRKSAQGATPAQRSVVLSDSKSKVPLVEPAPAPAPKPESPRRVIMSGSKSSGFIDAETLKEREARWKQAQQAQRQK
jgi:hypothetical protein